MNDQKAKKEIANSNNVAEPLAFRAASLDIDNLNDIKEYFGYNAVALSARNAMRVGINVFKESPELFRKTLTPVIDNNNTLQN